MRNLVVNACLLLCGILGVLPLQAAIPGVYIPRLPRDQVEQPVKPATPETFPLLPGESAGRSVSIGTVTDGFILNARPLPLPGRTYSVLPRQFRRGLIHGSDQLIRTLVFASEYVDQVYPGSILWLGNIGRDGGGDIPWSVSHNSGRDADLSFYVTDPNGVPVVPPDLLRFGSDGRSRDYWGYFRFDEARNWALAKALVQSPHARVQFLFISDPLRNRLLRYARERGEPQAIIDAVARVMQQPGPSIPHDDHLHLRVWCTGWDAAGGCEEVGRFASDSSLQTARRVALGDARRALGDEQAQVRIEALRRIGLLNARESLSSVQPLLADPVPLVRAHAVDAVAALGAEAQSGWLVARWEEEESDHVRERILVGLGRLGGREAGIFFARILAQDLPVTIAGKSYDLRLSALDALRRAARAEPIFLVVALLESADVELRARAAETLRLLANRDLDGLDWRQPLRESQRSAAIGAWREWLGASHRSPREEWLRDGFSRLGATPSQPPRQFAADLARLAGDSRPWVRENAQRTLMRISANQPRSLEWPPSDARTYWQRWVDRNPSRIGRF